MTPRPPRDRHGRIFQGESPDRAHADGRPAAANAVPPHPNPGRGRRGHPGALGPRPGRPRRRADAALRGRCASGAWAASPPSRPRPGSTSSRSTSRCSRCSSRRRARPGARTPCCAWCGAPVTTTPASSRCTSSSRRSPPARSTRRRPTGGCGRSSGSRRNFPVWAVSVASALLASAVAVMIGASALAAVATVLVVLAVDGGQPAVRANCVARVLRQRDQRVRRDPSRGGRVRGERRRRPPDARSRTSPSSWPVASSRCCPGARWPRRSRTCCSGSRSPAPGGCSSVLVALTGPDHRHRRRAERHALAHRRCWGRTSSRRRCSSWAPTRRRCVAAVGGALVVGLSGAVTVQSLGRLIVPTGVLSVGDGRRRGRCSSAWRRHRRHRRHRGGRGGAGCGRSAGRRAARCPVDGARRAGQLRAAARSDDLPRPLRAGRGQGDAPGSLSIQSGSDHAARRGRRPGRHRDRHRVRRDPRLPVGPHGAGRPPGGARRPGGRGRRPEATPEARLGRGSGGWRALGIRCRACVPATVSRRRLRGSVLLAACTAAAEPAATSSRLGAPSATASPSRGDSGRRGARCRRAAGGAGRRSCMPGSPVSGEGHDGHLEVGEGRRGDGRGRRDAGGRAEVEGRRGLVAVARQGRRRSWGRGRGSCSSSAATRGPDETAQGEPGRHPAGHRHRRQGRRGSHGHPARHLGAAAGRWLGEDQRRVRVRRGRRASSRACAR